MARADDAVAFLETLFRGLYTNHEPTRVMAANSMYDAMVKYSIHPLDISFNKESASEDDIYLILKQRLIEAERENVFLRRNVDPKILKHAMTAREIEFRWPELEELLEEKVPNVKHWGRFLKELCGVSITTVKMWSNGLARVPDSVFDAVREYVPLVAIPTRVKFKKTKKPKQGGQVDRKPSVPRYDWPDDVIIDVVNRWMSGATFELLIERVEEMTGVTLTSDQLSAKLYNSPPPAVMDVTVKDSGAMDWLEGWKVASATLPKGQKGWKGHLIKCLGLAKNTSMRIPLMNATTQTRVDNLRKEYADVMTERARPKPLNEELDLIVNFLLQQGPNGATNSELSNNGLQRRRIAELQRMGLVFISPDGMRNGQDVHIHRDFVRAIAA